MTQLINIMVDVEADGPVPPLYSMVSLGAVVVKPELDQTFYGQFRPISEKWDLAALSISGHSREECLAFPEASETIQKFAKWVASVVPPGGRPRFWSDNNGFDWSFVNYYFHAYYGSNPFGWSSVNLSSLYKGMKNNMKATYDHLMKTPHTHHPVDDAKGCAEALLILLERGLVV